MSAKVEIEYIGHGQPAVELPILDDNSRRIIYTITSTKKNIDKDLQNLIKKLK
jgi:hypothetical protein